MTFWPTQRTKHKAELLSMNQTFISFWTKWNHPWVFFCFVYINTDTNSMYGLLLVFYFINVFLVSTILILNDSISITQFFTLTLWTKTVWIGQFKTDSHSMKLQCSLDNYPLHYFLIYIKLNMAFLFSFNDMQHNRKKRRGMFVL